MTRTDRRETPTDDPITDRESTPMRDVSHTHPYADRGTVNRPFERGPVVAADGGEVNEVNRASSEHRSDGGKSNAYDAREEGGERPSEENARPSDEDARMRDVNHTAPHGEGESVDRVFERGGAEEPVESEE